MINELNKKELHILLHSLGWSYLDCFDIKKLDEEPYRNHFYTSYAGEDGETIKSLIDKNLMYDSGKGWSDSNNSHYFHVTENCVEELRNYLKNKLIKEKPSRSKMRYRLYLKCDVDETFHEWLTNKFWDSYRKEYGC